MSYNRVPQDFMKGVFIAPHNFSDPQTPVHGEYVNMQLRNDLYFSSINEISRVEFSMFGNNQQWIKVQQIKECVGQDPLFGIGTSIKKMRGRIPKETKDFKVNVLSCMDWKVVLHRDNKAVSETQYRIKILQTQSDLFRSQIMAPSFIKILKDLYLN